MAKAHLTPELASATAAGARTDVAPSVGWRYDVARDGRRFLLNASSGQEGRTPITLVINWTEQPAKR